MHRNKVCQYLSISRATPKIVPSPWDLESAASPWEIWTPSNTWFLGPTQLSPLSSKWHHDSLSDVAGRFNETVRPSSSHLTMAEISPSACRYSTILLLCAGSTRANSLALRTALAWSSVVRSSNSRPVNALPSVLSVSENTPIRRQIASAVACHHPPHNDDNRLFPLGKYCNNTDIKQVAKNFNKRPHRYLVTSRGGEWIRPRVDPHLIQMLPSANMRRLSNGISISSAVFTVLTNVTNSQRDTQTETQSDRLTTLPCVSNGSL